MIEVRLLAVTKTPNETGGALVLLESEGRILPILVGIPEAVSIQMAQMGEKPIRPLTHDLICNLLAGLRAQLQSITIYKLENDTFFAHMNIEQKNAEGQVEQILKIDARPSDSIAVALRVGCPIYVAEEVMEIASREIEFQIEEGEEHDEKHGEEPDSDEEDDENPF
ncbi:MAG TPA: bifunctional nuclease family protein [Candidatus Hydrogenedens sp.]|nr:bifunctional nuclease family protein [Candidatus Hydrogenedens sp.]